MREKVTDVSAFLPKLDIGFMAILYQIQEKQVSRRAALVDEHAFDASAFDRGFNPLQTYQQTFLPLLRIVLVEAATQK